MRCTILFAVLIVDLFARGGAQTCPEGGSCSCQLNNVEALQTLVRNEVETRVQQEVVRRLANITSKGCGIMYNIGSSLTWL